MNEAKCTAAAAAACVAYTHCRVILWRKEMFDNHLAIGRPPKRAAGSLALPLTPKAATTRRCFFQTPIKNSEMKLCRVILWRKEMFENHLAISAGRLTGSGPPGHWLKMLQWRDIVFIKACTQKVRIFSNVHTKYQPLVIGIDGLIQRLDR